MRAVIVQPSTGAGPLPSRLDTRTLLVPGPREGWSVSYYPEAREAVVWRESGLEALAGTQTADAPPGAEPGRASPPDPIAAIEDRQRASRRARGRVRRYATANRCSRLATFTYRVSQGDRATVKRDWAAFARRLKARYPGLAWVRVLEVHPKGHGLHIHAGLSAYVPKRELAALWGHGFVDVRKLRTKGGGREDARTAARYLAKYATKDLEAGTGLHGYEVAQGHAPAVVRLRAWTSDGAWREAVAAAGGELPTYDWSSSGDPDWTGPPVRFVSWD